MMSVVVMVMTIIVTTIKSTVTQQAVLSSNRGGFRVMQ